MRSAVVLAVIAALVLPTPAWSVTQQDVERACAASSQALRDLEAAETVLGEATVELNNTYGRVAAVTTNESTLQETIQRHEQTAVETQDDVVDRAVEVYMRGGLDFQMLLFSSASLGEILTIREVMAASAESDMGFLSNVNALAADTERARDDLSRVRNELRELEAAMEDRIVGLEEARDRAEETRRKLSGECARTKEAYDREVARREAEAAAARERDRQGGGSGGGGGVGLPAGFICPVSEGVSFSNDWGNPRSGGRTHAGTDMFARRGTPVVAVANGSISTANYGLGGIQVNLRADYGTRYYYAHLDGWAPDIKSGMQVRIGQILGYVGTSGNAAGTPPHLHFGITTTQRVNPFPTVRQACL